MKSSIYQKTGDQKPGEFYMQHIKIALYCAFIFLLHNIQSKASDIVHKDDLHRYFWAEYQRFGGNGKQAYEWYSDLLSSNPSPHVYKGYIHYLSQTNNYKKIFKLYKTHKDAFKNDGNIQLIFAQALEAIGKQHEADELLESLTHKFKQHAKITLYATQSLIRNKKFDKAIAVVDTILIVPQKRQITTSFIF